MKLNKINKVKDFKKSLRDWSKVIKNDKDWDWVFLLDVMVFKLGRMKELFEHQGHHTNDKKIARQIGQASDLLAKIAREDYPGKCIQDSDRLMQKDLDKALGIISKNLFTWWD